MIITKEKAKEISTQWGWKHPPKKGREYLRVSILYTQFLVNDNGIYKLYFEGRNEKER